MKKNLPKEGQQVSTAMGVATVVSGNPIKGTVLVKLESQATVELPLTEVTIEGERLNKQRKKPGQRG